MSDQIRLTATVYGRVQGVAFRYHTAMTARQLAVTGWVRNAPDGSVQVVAEGAADSIEAFSRWLHRGPQAARVHRVDLLTTPFTGEFANFEIRY